MLQGRQSDKGFHNPTCICISAKPEHNRKSTKSWLTRSSSGQVSPGLDRAGSRLQSTTMIAPRIRVGNTWTTPQAANHRHLSSPGYTGSLRKRRGWPGYRLHASPFLGCRGSAFFVPFRLFPNNLTGGSDSPYQTLPVLELSFPLQPHLIRVHFADTHLQLNSSQVLAEPHRVDKQKASRLGSSSKVQTCAPMMLTRWAAQIGFAWNKDDVC